MAELITLIDPNDENLEELIGEVNILKPNNVWVGCSTSSGDEMAKVFNELNVDASLYPGNLDQIEKTGHLARHIYGSDPLIYSREEINKLFEDCFTYVKTNFPGKCDLMNFAVLHPNSDTARILGLTKIPTDEEVIEALSNSMIHKIIYFEGGSRNQNSPISERLDLIKAVRSKYDKNLIICGGGISTVGQADELKEHCSHVIISNTIHKDPKSLKEYMDVFRESQTADYRSCG